MINLEVFVDGKQLLEDLIIEYVPDEYQPRGGKPGLVTNITLIGTRRLTSFLKSNQTESSDVYGVTVNWDLLREKAGMKNTFSPLSNKCGIFLSVELVNAIEQLKFVLLHEIGHVDWFHKKRTNKKLTWEVENNELYSDLYAFEILKEFHGLDRAVDALNKYGSSLGWGEYLKSGSLKKERQHG